MFKLIDNAIPDNVFQMLSSDVTTLKSDASSAKDVVAISSLAEIKSKLGIAWFILWKEIEKHFDKPICPCTCRKQIVKSEIFDWHRDGALPIDHPKASLEKSYSAILYVHHEWIDIDSIGCWQSEDRTVLPLSNRLIIFSRDILHRIIPGEWDLRATAMISFYEVFND